MAKKSFKTGLDSLLASAGIKKKTGQTKVSEKKEEKNFYGKEISESEKHWMAIKLEKLDYELSLWRTGKLSIGEFQKSLKEYGLTYHASTNEIIEK